MSSKGSAVRSVLNRYHELKERGHFCAVTGQEKLKEKAVF